MSDLTRDEVRRACELVGWEFKDFPGGGYFYAQDQGGVEHFYCEGGDVVRQWDGDAIALLVAYDWHVLIEWIAEDRLWAVDLYPISDDPSGGGPVGVHDADLSTAAVRAVLASAGGES